MYGALIPVAAWLEQRPVGLLPDTISILKQYFLLLPSDAVRVTGNLTIGTLGI